METGKVDWDKLEGDALNVALVKAAWPRSTSWPQGNTSWISIPGYPEGGWVYGEMSEHGTLPLPDYANSIDAQKRDLEPLLEKPHEMSVNWHPSELDLAFASDEWGAAISGFVSFHKKEETARARCLGKALEARKANANVK